MSHRFARIALMLGNFVTGVAILGLAGMLPDLASGLGVTIQHAGLLVTFGAVVLCIGAPLMAWATSRLDRRMVLAGALTLVALGHVASAFAPNYAVLLALRVATMAFAAPLTPVAASTIALIVPNAERSSAIVFIFLGFSLSVAAGLPIVTFLSAHLGWQATFAIIGLACLASAALIWLALPGGVRGDAISLRSWSVIGHNRLILVLLLLTCVQVSGQFIIFTYLSPLLTRLAGASVATIGTFFSIFGIAGVVGNAIATRLVTTLKPWGTSLAALVSVFVGFALWSFGTPMLPVMGAGMVCWGLGFAAINSMQQARLVAAAPALSSASVSLNTSGIYVGQAIGSGLGGVLFAHDLPRALGFAAMAFGAAALVVLIFTRPRAEDG
jgi:DHA1 family inner membrane transport protein